MSYGVISFYHYCYLALCPIVLWISISFRGGTRVILFVVHYKSDGSGYARWSQADSKRVNWDFTWEKRERKKKTKHKLGFHIQDIIQASRLAVGTYKQWEKHSLFFSFLHPELDLGTLGDLLTCRKELCY